MTPPTAATSRRARRARSKRRIAPRLFKALGVFLAATILPVIALRWVPPPASSLMVQRVVAAHWRGDAAYRLHYRWVGIDRISPQMAIAVVASEDQKFPYHFGFDFDAMAKAIEEDRRHPRGASTISQQVAKNLFLWPERSWIRKGLEAYFTVLMEGLWPKRRILEVYLNIVEMGPGIFGVGAASEAYFHKPPGRLTSREAALLAAVLPNPLAFKVSRPSAYVLERVEDIQGQMRHLGGPAYLRGILPAKR